MRGRDEGYCFYYYYLQYFFSVLFISQVDLAESQKMWDVIEVLQKFVTESKQILWAEMDTNELDEQSKNQVCNEIFCLFISIHSME